MRTRTIILAAVAVLVGAALVPAIASASSLLSGYGGPGQGSQAILGSTLLNGPRGGSGGGGGSSQPSSSEVTPAALSSATTTTSASGGRPQAGSSRSSQGAVSGGVRPRGHGTGRKVQPSAHKAASPAYIVSRHADEPLLGISAGDLLAMIVAAGALVFVGGLTRRSARSGAPGPTPKAIGPNNRADG